MIYQPARTWSCKNFYSAKKNKTNVFQVYTPFRKNSFFSSQKKQFQSGRVSSLTVVHCGTIPNMDFLSATLVKAFKPSQSKIQIIFTNLKKILQLLSSHHLFIHNLHTDHEINVLQLILPDCCFPGRCTSNRMFLPALFFYIVLMVVILFGVGMHSFCVCFSCMYMQLEGAES